MAPGAFRIQLERRKLLIGINGEHHRHVVVIVVVCVVVMRVAQAVLAHDGQVLRRQSQALGRDEEVPVAASRREVHGFHAGCV